MEVQQASNVLFQHLVAKRRQAFRDTTLKVKRANKRREAFHQHQAQLFALTFCSCVVQLLVPSRMTWAHERSSEWWETS